VQDLTPTLPVLGVNNYKHWRSQKFLFGRGSKWKNSGDVSLVT